MACPLTTFHGVVCRSVKEGTLFVAKSTLLSSIVSTPMPILETMIDAKRICIFLKLLTTHGNLDFVCSSHRPIFHGFDARRVLA